MPPAALAAVAVGTAVVSAYGQYKAGKDQAAAANRAGNLFGPQNVMARMRQLNPQLYEAAYGPNIFGNPQYGSFADYIDWQARVAPKAAANPMASLYQMPGYIDPTLMNEGLQQIDEQYTRNIAGGGNFAAQMGLAGGMADMYSFAAQAARQRARQDVYQNYQQQREQLKRQDIEMGQNLLNQAQGQSLQGIGQKAQYTSQAFNPTNWATQLGQVGSAALTAYGSMAAGGAGVAASKMMPQGQGPMQSYQYPVQQFQQQFQAPRRFSGYENFGTNYGGYAVGG